MVEKNLYPLFAKKLKELGFVDTCAFELKIVKSKRFSLNSVHQHQIDGLLGALHGLYLRIADQPFMQGGFQQKKSFDCLWINNAKGFVVPVFYIPRKRKTAYLIPIEEFVKLEGKSVTEENLSVFPSIDL